MCFLYKKYWQDLFEVSVIIIFVLQIKKLMCRYVIYLVQGDKITEW